jgi:hypothetical protein
MHCKDAIVYVDSNAGSKKIDRTEYATGTPRMRAERKRVAATRRGGVPWFFCDSCTGTTRIAKESGNPKATKHHMHRSHTTQATTTVAYNYSNVQNIPTPHIVSTLRSESCVALRNKK